MLRRARRGRSWLLAALVAGAARARAGRRRRRCAGPSGSPSASPTSSSVSSRPTATRSTSSPTATPRTSSTARSRRRPGAKLALRRGRRRHLAARQPRRQAPALHLVPRRGRRPAVRARPARAKHRRCLDDGRQRACRRSGSTTRASRWSAATTLRATCGSSPVDVGGRALAAHPLARRNLTSPTVSPDGRWLVYVPVAALRRAASGPASPRAPPQRLEAMRLDRPGDPAACRSALDLPGLTGQPAFARRRQARSTSPSSSTTPTATASSTPAITACSSACPSTPTRRRAGARRRRRGPSSSPTSTWNCQYPSPAAALLVTTCSRPAAPGSTCTACRSTARCRPTGAPERLARRGRAVSARRSEQRCSIATSWRKTKDADGAAPRS